MVKRKAAQLWDTQTDRHPTVIIRACDVGRTSGDEVGCAAVGHTDRQTDRQTDRHPTVIIRACDVGRTSGVQEGCTAVAAGFSDSRVLTVGWTMHIPDTCQFFVAVLTVLCQFTQQQQLQLQLLGRRRGAVVSGVRRMNEVNTRRLS